jgi:hypothetical protein
LTADTPPSAGAPPPTGPISGIADDRHSAGAGTPPGRTAKPSRIPRPRSRRAEPVSATQTGGSAPSRWHARLTGPSTAAIVVWAALVAPAVALPRMIPFDGYGVKGWALPMGAGLAGGVVLLALAVWRRGAPWVAGASAGFLASWLTLMLGTSLRGTPYGFYGLQGDAGQLSAMAVKYSVTAATTDPLLVGTPAEYPPLFPWTIGRIADLIDVPAWRLIGIGETVCTGLALLLGFLLWQRLVPVWVALGTTTLGMMIFENPAKAFEMVTLAMFVPWALGTFGRPARGRLHWLTSGVVAGVTVLTYYGWMLFGGIGLVVIAIQTLRAESARRAFLLYLAKVVGVALMVSSWFVLPYLFARVTSGGEALSDKYADLGMIADMLPFIGVSPLAVLQLCGVVGLIWLRGSTRAWWATPMLMIVVGAYAFRAVGSLSFLLTGHTWMSHYTPRLYSTVLAMAGVLTLVEATPRLIERLRLTAPKGGAAFALAIALVWCMFTFTTEWTPGIGGRYSYVVEPAYAEPLPDGSTVAGLPELERTPWFPVTPIQQEVERVYGGPNRDHVALSADDRLFSFLPWPGYTGNTPGGALAHTAERIAELRRLASTTDPEEFARVSADTAYGPIDIFALKVTEDGWRWSAYTGFQQDEAVVLFQASQFSSSHWVVSYLPNNTVLAVRRP